MTAPLTDKQLNRAILERLGWKGLCIAANDNLYGSPPEDREQYKGHSLVPNYTGDIAAATGLLEEFPRWELLKLSDGYSCYVYLNSKGPYKRGVNYYFATHPDNKSRAISEAAYSALIARRNDGNKQR